MSAAMRFHVVIAALYSVGQTREEAVLRDTINEAVKTAMKARDERRVSTLRLVNAAIKNAEIEAERGSKALSEDDILGLMQKMIKQRQESVEIYDKAGRKELA